MSLFFVFLGEVGGREGANLWGGGGGRFLNWAFGRDVTRF